MFSNRDEPLSFVNPSSSPITLSDASETYLLDPTTSASGSFQNDGFLRGGSDGGGSSETELGFSRAEFRRGQLVGTVKFYERHVFLCYKNPLVWPSHIEAAEFDRLPRLLWAAMEAKKCEMKRETRLTICEGHDGTETSNGDVLIFPDMITYRRLTHFDVDKFVEEVLVKEGKWLPGTPEPLMKGAYIFVCCHGSRDRRCGVCGPALVSKFREEIESRSLQSKVSVSPCSHIGGDKYAGNVMIFGSNIYGEVNGHWYGYVSPDSVPILLEHHVLKREIVDSLWRGQMGLSEEEQKKSQELRQQLNGESDIGKRILDSKPIVTEERIASSICGPRAEACCQENSSCCQNHHVMTPSNRCNSVPKQTETKAIPKNGSKKRSSRIDGPDCTPPVWYENWEREDTYTVLAVAFAAASVAVACSCYRQLT